MSRICIKFTQCVNITYLYNMNVSAGHLIISTVISTQLFYNTQELKFCFGFTFDMNFFFFFGFVENSPSGSSLIIVTACEKTQIERLGSCRLLLFERQGSHWSHTTLPIVSTLAFTFLLRNFDCTFHIKSRIS